MALDPRLFNEPGARNAERRPAAPQRPRPKKPTAEPKEAKAPEEPKRVRPAEPAAAETVTTEGAEAVLRNIEAACNGNRYLEAMILGEILNSPRF